MSLHELLSAYAVYRGHGYPRFKALRKAWSYAKD